MRSSFVRFILGLDIGTNSVGSAWIDLRDKTVRAAVSVFPAGVEQRDDKRGEPNGQARRGKRLARRLISRRAKRKWFLRKRLVELGFLPSDAADCQRLFERTDPWTLRSEALRRSLTRHEFGQVLSTLRSDVALRA